MMVENGLLDKYKPDVAVMAHMASDIVKTNQIMLKSGPCSASSDRFVVHLHGKGGHGARPISPSTHHLRHQDRRGLRGHRPV